MPNQETIAKKRANNLSNKTIKMHTSMVCIFYRKFFVDNVYLMKYACA